MTVHQTQPDVSQCFLAVIYTDGTQPKVFKVDKTAWVDLKIGWAKINGGATFVKIRDDKDSVMSELYLDIDGEEKSGAGVISPRNPGRYRAFLKQYEAERWIARYRNAA